MGSPDQQRYRVNLLYDTQELRKSMKLCDWAYLKLTGAVADAVYGKGTNEAVTAGRSS